MLLLHLAVICKSVCVGGDNIEVTDGTESTEGAFVFKLSQTDRAFGIRRSYCPTGTITIPESFSVDEWRNCDRVPVTSLYFASTGAFEACEELESVSLPDSITYIGMNAFSGCTGLKSISLGASVESIASGAFSECIELSSITLPESLKVVEAGAFDSAELKQVGFCGLSDLAIDLGLDGDVSVFVRRDYDGVVFCGLNVIKEWVDGFRLDCLEGSENVADDGFWGIEAIVGVVIGFVAFICLWISVVIYIVRRRAQNKDATGDIMSPEDVTSEGHSTVTLQEAEGVDRSDFELNDEILAALENRSDSSG